MAHAWCVIKRVIIAFRALNGPLLSTKTTSTYIRVTSCLFLQCGTMFIFILSQLM